MNANSEDETTKRKAEREASPAIDRIPMDEHRRYLIKIVMLMRVDMRELFGMEVANRWGFWVDRYLGKQVRDFADWIPYPKGDHVLEKDKVSVRAAVMSDDCNFLFTVDYLGMIKVWNMMDDRVIQEWVSHKRVVSGLAFQSGLLISGSFDKTIKIWDTLRDYQLIHTLEGHREYVKSVDINNKATQVVSGSLDKSIRIWSVKTGECIRVLMGHSGWVSSVQFIGNLILSGSFDRSIKIWNQSDGTEIRSANEGIRGSIYDVSINYDASLVACVTGSGLFFHTWPELKFIRKVDARLSRCAFHPIHPSILAVNNRERHSIRILDLTNDNVIRTLDGHSKDIEDFCFSPDGFRLVSVSCDKSVRAWDISDDVIQ